MTTRLLFRTTRMLLVGGLVPTLFLVAGNALAQVRRLDSKNFEILGIRLGSSELNDLDRVLGRAPTKQATHIEDTTTCYASAGDDGIILEFDAWLTSVVEFRFYRGSAQSNAQCAKSKLVSDSLSTASGLKLGMNRSEILALLGPPTNEQKDRLIYESSYDRALTPEEVRRFEDGFSSPPALVNVYEKIDLQFQKSQLAQVDVTRVKDW